MDDATKAVFAMAAESRKARWIKNKLIRFAADESQVETFHEIFEDWVRRWGKEGAVDYLLSALCEAQAKLTEWDDAKRAAKKRARLSRSKQHSPNGRH